MIGAGTAINMVRFCGDATAAKFLLEDPECCKLIGAVGPPPVIQARRNLLANAVRIDEEVLPGLGRILADVEGQAGLAGSLELFVYQCPFIEAGVLPAADRYLALVSSGCIERFTQSELRFVIGHELGHVAYGHFDIPVDGIMNADVPIEPKKAMMLFSWHRKAEISADRAGLLCSGSLDVAASALFKAVSGLAIPDLKVNPLRFAQQFDELKEEIWRGGADGMWAARHPFPPLRMKALVLYSEHMPPPDQLANAMERPEVRSCDQEIENLLAFMDPMAREDPKGIDPLLVPFILWAGMFVAGSNRKIERSELGAIAQVVGETHITKALKEPRSLSVYRKNFRGVLESRQQPLCALDIGRILTCLVAVARADGAVDDAERAAMRTIAQDLGVPDSYIDHLLSGDCR